MLSSTISSNKDLTHPITCILKLSDACESKIQFIPYSITIDTEQYNNRRRTKDSFVGTRDYLTEDNDTNPASTLLSHTTPHANFNIF